MPFYYIPYDPKTLRETLCAVQGIVDRSPTDPNRKKERSDCLQRLINACDELRPLGSDGKHGSLHTPYCGCEDGS